MAHPPLKIFLWWLALRAPPFSTSVPEAPCGRVKGTGGNGQHFSWGFFSLVPFNPNPINPLRIKAKSQMRTKMQWQGRKPVKWVKGLVLTCEICKFDENKHTVYCHCYWKLDNCKDDCFIQQSVISIVKVFLLNCSPPSEVGLKPHPPLLLFHQWKGKREKEKRQIYRKENKDKKERENYKKTKWKKEKKTKKKKEN